MGIKEGALALADELEAFEDGDCEECSLYGQPECKGHLSCMEIMARYAARKMREAVERDAEDVTTVSAYDLLPEEDREALAWVREMGGVEAAKARTMPEGCEWPRFEDGEPVKLRDVIVPPEGGEPREVDCINHFKDCWYIGLVGASSDRLKRGERVKRPENPVLAADGEPLEVGQTVYATHYGYAKCTVLAIEWVVDGYLVEVENEGGHKFRQTPDEFIHQRPVLAADGDPLEVGQTVWGTGRTQHEFKVLQLNDPMPETGERFIVRCLDTDEGDECLCDPRLLTHTKPEPPDTWERIEEDKDLNPFDYCKKVGHKLWTFDNAEEFKASDIVRRCRALAERGEL